MSLCIELDCQCSLLPDGVMLSIAACQAGEAGSYEIFFKVSFSFIVYFCLIYIQFIHKPDKKHKQMYVVIPQEL